MRVRSFPNLPLGRRAVQGGPGWCRPSRRYKLKPGSGPIPNLSEGTMLRFLLMIVTAMLVIVGVAFAFGSSLPREHVATSRIELAQPIDQVWTVVRNPAALRGVWGDLTSAERVTD